MSNNNININYTDLSDAFTKLKGFADIIEDKDVNNKGDINKTSLSEAFDTLKKFAAALEKRTYKICG